MGSRLLIQEGAGEFISCGFQAAIPCIGKEGARSPRELHLFIQERLLLSSVTFKRRRLLGGVRSPGDLGRAAGPESSKAEWVRVC